MFPRLQFNKISRNKLLIAYKLLHDALFILVLFFVIALFGEGLLPGLVSSHLGLYKILIVVLADILAINFFSVKLEMNPAKFSPQKTALALLLVLSVLLFNSLLKAGLILNLFILILAGLIFYFLYKTIFPGKINF
ncbi:MAG: hypothetical protein AAB487_02495 [Patescibacteria group bacterium]|mgnify:CR=1 FL=1